MILLGCVVLLAEAACGDDTAPSRVDAAADLSVSQDAAGGTDLAAGDTVVPDTVGGTILSPTNHPEGFGQKWCFETDCHVSPIVDHLATEPQQCPECHGGNGACDPNGANSTLKTHFKTMHCSEVGCHDGGHHGFTAESDCVACHFASAGLADCP